MARSTGDARDGARGGRGRLRRSLPLIGGAVIASAGLALGSLAAADAQDHHRPPTVDQQAAEIHAQDAATPVNGNTETNVNVLEDQIKHYYGAATATFPVVGTVTVPSPTGNYAKQMRRIVTDAESYLAAAKRGYHGTAKPAVVFDIDDTLLNTYDYTLASQFGFNPATNQVWVDAGAFPAVFDMPELVGFAAKQGYAVFFITGRPQSQTAATIANLTNVGYPAPDPGRLFLKPATPPSYLNCAKSPTCTTIEYKSGTRKFISGQGYAILADVGDQYSDLLGGDAGHQIKLPNPMYYLP